jgi:GNAT superfamily N-acetyltransferase
MTSTDTSPIYKVIRIPRTSSRLADLVTKFRHTKLAALEADSVSFASQYAIESALPLEVWTNRLSQETTILICVAISNESIPLEDEDALIQGEWVGFAAVRGPMKYSDYYFYPEMGLPIPSNPDAETRWHIYDIYTCPSHRGKGLAKRLIAGCIETAVEYTTAMSENHQLRLARLNLFMNPKNTWLLKMYENVGFEGVGKVTLTEAFRANAMDESLPEDSDSTEELRTMWHSRHGLAMERVVEVK